MLSLRASSPHAAGPVPCRESYPFAHLGRKSISDVRHRVFAWTDRILIFGRPTKATGYPRGFLTWRNA